MEPNNQIQQTINQTQIVTFIDEGDVKENVMSVPPVIPGMDEPATDALRHSVVDILSRPIEFKNFTWTRGSPWGTEIETDCHLPASWLQIPMIREKLASFYYLKCNFRVKVQVNAMPMNAGRLLIFFDPLEDQQQTLPSNLLHFGGVTGYRRVELDLSDATSADLVVPFNLPISHFDLVHGIGLLGKVRMYVYSQLTGTIDVQGTIWLSAEDVDVQMSTGMPILPRDGQVHAGEARGQNGLTADDIAYNTTQREGETDDEFAERIRGLAKGLVVQVDPEKAQKQEKKNPSIISQVAGTVGKVGRALGWLPIVGTAASIAGFVGDAVAGVASLFGWSKPHDDRAVTTIIPVAQPNMANFQGDSKAKVLALDANNRTIHPSHVFGTNEDEMSIQHIIRKPVFIDRFKLRETDVPNQVVWKFPVSPAACPKLNVLINAVPKQLKLNTYMSYLSECFGAWRGTIKYNFKIVKTVFHTARIRVSFIPGMFENTPLNLIDVNKMYSKVIDIRNVTQFDLEVPFVYHQPWASLDDDVGLNGNLSESLPTGIVIVEVLNTLVSTNNAANTIEFIVETCAGDDFQFAFPAIVSRYNPVASAESIDLVSKKLANFDMAATSEKFSKHGPADTPKVSKVQTKTYHNMIGGAKSVTTTIQIEDDEEKGTQMEVINPQPPQPSMPDIVKEKEAPSGAPPSYIADLPVAPRAIRPNLNARPPQYSFTIDDYNKMWEQSLVDGNGHDQDFAKFISIYKLEPGPAAWERPQELMNGELREASRRLRDLCTRDGICHAMIDGPTASTVTVNAMGPGEIVTSLRQLLKRYSFMGARPSTPSLTPLAITPFATVGDADITRTVSAPNIEWVSLFDRFSMLFRWMSGSMRLMIQTTEDYPLNKNSFSVRPGWQTKYPQGDSRFRSSGLQWADFNNQCGPNQIFIPSLEKVVELQIPFYQRNPAKPTGVGKPQFVDVDSTFILDRVPNNLGSSVLVDSNQAICVYSAIGEDFSFGYLLGPPISVR